MGAVLFRITTIPVFDSNGDPVSGAKAYFYLTETLTPTPVYSDSDLSIAHTNPVVANSAGVFPDIYLDSDVTHRLRVTDADDNLLFEADPYGDLAAEEIVTKLAGQDVSLNTLRVTATDEASLSSTTHGLQIGAASGANLAMDTNEIQARNNGAGATLALNPDGGTVTFEGSGFRIMPRTLNPTSLTDGADLTSAHNGRLVRLSGASGRSWRLTNIATGGWADGSFVIVAPTGSGGITITRQSGVEMYYNGSNANRTIAQGGFGILMHHSGGLDEWTLVGVGIT